MRDSTKPDASDICVFCHTPNVSGAPPTNAPLWQRSIGTDLVFAIYDDIGRLGLGKQSIGSQSMACLSCHDANQARSISKTSADHPFGVPYRGATKGSITALAAPLHGPSAAPADPSVWARHLFAIDDFRDVSQGVIENRRVWWVSATPSGYRTRNDLPLYTRNYDGTGEDLPFIECSSCHDPHTNNSKFLRLPTAGSQLCLTCHLK